MLLIYIHPVAQSVKTVNMHLMPLCQSHVVQEVFKNSTQA